MAGPTKPAKPANQGRKPGLCSSSRLALPSNGNNNNNDNNNNNNSADEETSPPTVKKGPPRKKKKSAHQVFADSLGHQMGLGLPVMSGTLHTAKIESDEDMNGGDESGQGPSQKPPTLQQRIHQRSISATSTTSAAASSTVASAAAASTVASIAAATAKKNAEAAAKKALEEKHNGEYLISLLKYYL